MALPLVVERSTIKHNYKRQSPLTLRANPRKEYSYLTKQLILHESKGKMTDHQVISFNDKQGEKTVKHPDGAWKLYRKIYEEIPVAKNSVDHTADFAVQSGYQLEGPESAKKKINDFIKRHNFDILMVDILKQMQIFGNAYLELGKNKTGEIVSVKMLPPEQMYVVVFAGENNDGELKGYKQIIKPGQEINFNPDEIAHFKWNTASNPFYGVSDLRAVVGILTRLLQFQEDVGEIIHRYGNPIIHWILGSEDSPATKEQVESFKNMLDERETGEDVITSFGVSHEVISSNLKITQPDGMLKHLENQLIAGLRVPEIFIRGGETSNKATADVELQAFDRRVKSIRRAFARIVEDKVFKQISPASDVTIEFNEMSVETEATKAEMLERLVKSQIPPELALQMVGWGSWVDEFDKLKDDMPPPLQPRFPNPPPKEPPKEEDFETQADYYEALERYSRQSYLKGSNEKSK